MPPIKHGAAAAQLLPPAPVPPPTRILVVDNGGAILRAGFAGNDLPAVNAPNATARIKRQLRLLVADEIESKIKDASQLQYFRPIERGYVTDAAVQGVVWDRVLFSSASPLAQVAASLSSSSAAASAASSVPLRPETCTLILSAPPFMPASLSKQLDELVMNTYGFGAYLRITPQELAALTFRKLEHNSSSGDGGGRGGGDGSNTTTSNTSNNNNTNEYIEFLSVHPNYKPPQATSSSSGANDAYTSAFAPLASPSFAQASPSTSPAVLQHHQHHLHNNPILPLIAPKVSRESSTCGLAFTKTGTGVIIDFGYSFTLITPFIAWKPVPQAIQRVDVGGKALTNALKEMLSYRQFNLMDDAALVSRVKEALCFTALNFTIELQIAKKLSQPSILHKAMMIQARLGLTAAAATATINAAAAALSSSSSSSSSSSNAVAASQTKNILTDVEEQTTIEQTSSASSSSSSSSLHYDDGPYKGYTQSRRISGTHSKTRPTQDGIGVGIRREYVLPDFFSIKRGYVRGGPEDTEYVKYLQQVLAMEQEREKQQQQQSLMDIDQGSSSGRSANATIATMPTSTTSEKKSTTLAAESSTTANVKIGKTKAAKEKQKKNAEGSTGAKQASKTANKIKQTTKKKKSKKRGSDDDDDDDDEEDDDAEDEDDSSSEDDADDDGTGENGKKDGDYGGGKKGSKAAVDTKSSVPLRRGSARASKAGVSALTASMKRDGLIENDEEDEGASGGNNMQDGTADDLLARTAFAPSTGVGGTHATIVSSFLSTSNPNNNNNNNQQQQQQQALVLNHERIVVPEALFRPSTIGVNQAGIAEAIQSAIHKCPAVVQPALWSSILLIGAGAQCCGLEARLYAELRSLAPIEVDIALFTPSDPATVSWRGGSILGCNKEILQSLVVTREEYQARGNVVFDEKFGVRQGPADDILLQRRREAAALATSQREEADEEVVRIADYQRRGGGESSGIGGIHAVAFGASSSSGGGDFNAQLGGAGGGGWAGSSSSTTITTTPSAGGGGRGSSSSKAAAATTTAIGNIATGGRAGRRGSNL